MIARKPGRRKVADGTLPDIQSFHDEHGMCPSVRELAEAAGVSIAAMQDRLDVLERHGLIVRERQSARTIRLTPAGKAALTTAA